MALNLHARFLHGTHPTICAIFIFASPAFLPFSFQRLGVKLSNPDDADSIEKLALVMFDTRTIKGLDFNPFSSNNVLKLNAVQEYPQDLYFILRTVLMFRGMAQVRGHFWRCLSCCFCLFCLTVFVCCVAASCVGRFCIRDRYVWFALR